MSAITLDLEIALFSRLTAANVNAWNLIAPSDPAITQLGNGYVVVSPVSDVNGGTAETQDGHEWTLVYALKGIASTRLVALQQADRALSAILATPLTLASGSVWRVKRTSGIPTYLEQLGGGAIAIHAGHVLTFNITEP